MLLRKSLDRIEQREIISLLTYLKGIDVYVMRMKEETQEYANVYHRRPKFYFWLEQRKKGYGKELAERAIAYWNNAKSQVNVLWTDE